MQQVKRYYKRAKISEVKFRHLLRLFALELTASDAARLTGPSRVSTTASTSACASTGLACVRCQSSRKARSRWTNRPLARALWPAPRARQTGPRSGQQNHRFWAG